MTAYAYASPASIRRERGEREAPVPQVKCRLEATPVSLPPLQYAAFSVTEDEPYGRPFQPRVVQAHLRYRCTVAVGCGDVDARAVRRTNQFGPFGTL